MLHLWRVVLRLPQALTPQDMPQNGATETARLGSAELGLTSTRSAGSCTPGRSGPAHDYE